jgi:hypothetical protein
VTPVLQRELSQVALDFIADRDLVNSVFEVEHLGK